MGTRTDIRAAQAAAPSTRSTAYNKSCLEHAAGLEQKRAKVKLPLHTQERPKTQSMQPEISIASLRVYQSRFY